MQNNEAILLSTTIVFSLFLFGPPVLFFFLHFSVSSFGSPFHRRRLEAEMEEAECSAHVCTRELERQAVAARWRATFGDGVGLEDWGGSIVFLSVWGFSNYKRTLQPCCSISVLVELVLGYRPVVIEHTHSNHVHSCARLILISEG